MSTSNVIKMSLLKCHNFSNIPTWFSAEENARKVNNTLIVNDIDDGKKQKSLEIAKNLLSTGMNINKIYDILNVEDEDIKKEIKKLSKKVKKIEELTDDPDMVQYIDVEKGMELGRKEDIEKAAKKAAKEAAEKEKIETAKKMLKDKLDVNVISKYTGLSKEEINSLN